jgi:hypothetical protein
MRKAMAENTPTSSRATLLLLLVVLIAALGLLWLLVRGPQPLSTFAAAAVGFGASKLYESWAESKTRLHEKKRDVYQQLLEPYLRLTLSSITKEDAGKLGASMAPEVVRSTFQAIMYGSDDVLRRVNDLRRESQKGTVEGTRLLFLIGSLLRAVRRDLGNFTTMSEVEILDLFVNMSPEDQQKLVAASRE